MRIVRRSHGARRAIAGAAVVLGLIVLLAWPRVRARGVGDARAAMADSAVKPQGQDHRVPPDSVWASADTLASVAGVSVTLRVSAWRDFMPSPVRRGGSDLMVNLVLQSTDSTPFPAGLMVDSAWVRSPEGTWPAAPSQERRPDVPRGMDLMLRGGPTWTPGIPLDVLVRLRAPSGAVTYLRDRRAAVGRVS